MKHYTRWKRHGDPLGFVKYEENAEKRFWSNVDAEGDCWEWTRSRNVRGYGVASVNGKQRPAHRVAWEFLVGPIPEGMQLDHLCYNPPCVNPDHLEVVTPRVNSLRSRTRPGQSRKTHCINGHRFTPDNTYIRKDTASRQCRTCSYERNKARRLARMGST